jgi:hypothetical protein
MRPFGARPLRPGLASLLLAIALVLGACETTTYGGYVGSAYYDGGFSDPWYYGGDDWHDGDVTAPPAGRPEPPPRPEHPIVRPPAPRPMPSIPSRPRPASRR